MLLTENFFADLQWWISFMSIFNGTCRIQDPRPSPHSRRMLLREVEDTTMETTSTLIGH